MILFETGNMLLGGIPESVGLLIFGVALVAVTIGLRWFLGGEPEQAEASEPVKNLTENDQVSKDILSDNLILDNK